MIGDGFIPGIKMVGMDAYSIWERMIGNVADVAGQHGDDPEHASAVLWGLLYCLRDGVQHPNHLLMEDAVQKLVLAQRTDGIITEQEAELASDPSRIVWPADRRQAVLAHMALVMASTSDGVNLTVQA